MIAIGSHNETDMRVIGEMERTGGPEILSRDDRLDKLGKAAARRLLAYLQEDDKSARKQMDRLIVFNLNDPAKPEHNNIHRAFAARLALPEVALPPEPLITADSVVLETDTGHITLGVVVPARYPDAAAFDRATGRHTPADLMVVTYLATQQGDMRPGQHDHVSSLRATV